LVNILNLHDSNTGNASDIFSFTFLNIFAIAELKSLSTESSVWASTGTVSTD
jgi:hypothetical protein